MDQQFCALSCFDYVPTWTRVTGEHHFQSRVLDLVAHCTVEGVDHWEAGNRHPIALIHRVGAVIWQFVWDRRSATCGLQAAEGAGIPRQCFRHVVNERCQAQFRLVGPAAPDLHRVYSTYLGEASKQAGHIPDVIGVKVRQEYL